MDDPATIVQYVTKVKNEIPADHYALFISATRDPGGKESAGTTMDEVR